MCMFERVVEIERVPRIAFAYLGDNRDELGENLGDDPWEYEERLAE